MGQSIIWQDQSLTDENKISSGSTFSDPSATVTVTLTWSISTDGGSFIAFGGSDFVSYESGMLGAESGYVSLGFDNDSEDQDDKINVTLSFSPAVQGLTFSLLDVDEADDDDGSSTSHWDDVVEVLYNGGTNANSKVASSGSCTEVDNETFVTGYEGIEDINGCGDDGTDLASSAANVNYDFGSTYINSVSISYFSGDDITNSSDPNAQLIGVGDLAWTGTLPVELVEFSVSKIPSSSMVKFTWITASEINNDYFSLEQSVNGTDFFAVTKVKGAGTSENLQTYFYEHSDPTHGRSYFRLKQVDFDGSFTYSKVIHLNTVATSSYSIYPTYASEKLTAVGVSEQWEWEFEILDMFGRHQVGQLILDGSPNQIDISHLKPGVYFFRIPDLDQPARKFFKK